MRDGTGWDSIFRVVDGSIAGATVNEAEAMWIRACWLATGALKDRVRSKEEPLLAE